MSANVPLHLQVAILGGNGRPIGSGLVLDNRHVLTCAHLLADDQTSTSPSSEREFMIQALPWEDTQPATARLLPGAWKPNLSRLGDQGIRDLALLTLESPLVGDRNGWAISPAVGESKSQFAVFAFTNHQRNGIWSEVVLRPEVADSWRQIDNTATTPYRIQEGFSGTPVFDAQAKQVVGIIAEADSAGIPVGFLIPGSALLKFLDESMGLEFTNRFRPRPSYRDGPELYPYNIERFDEYYLGRPDEPVPFGGRREELRQLTEWLRDPEAPRQLLIAAPAGRGKTTLVLNWLRQVPADFKVAFVPISHRFETNRLERSGFGTTGEPVFYEALARQLAKIAGDAADISPHNLANHYHGQCVELLRRIQQLKVPTVVIVDGIDETAGWRNDPNLFRCPSDGTVRIVASGRPLAGDRSNVEGWLTRLEWSPGQTRMLALPPLSEDDIGDALDVMNGPADESRPYIIKSLLRITGGDPLLVRRYAEDLWKQRDASERITPADLDKIGSGYSGFFKHWFEKQEGNWRESNGSIRKHLDAILAVLTLALGPIKLRDVEEICRRFFEERRPAFTKDAIEPLERFLVGDGRESGYAFQHQKLALYFREEYFKNGRIVSDMERTIADWFSSTIDTLVANQQLEYCPPYVLDYYGRYLSELVDKYGTTDATVMRIEQFLGEECQRAWFERDGGYDRYTINVQALMEGIRTGDHSDAPFRFALRVRCGLILSSIRSVGINTPPELLIALVNIKKMSSREALYRLRFRGDEVLAVELPKLFEVADDTTAAKIVEICEGFRGERARALAFGALAGKLPGRRVEFLELALAIIEKFSADEFFKAPVFVSLADQLRGEHFDRAVAAVERMWDKSAADTALTSLAKYLPEPMLERALTTAIKITSLSSHDDTAFGRSIAALALRLPETALESVLSFCEETTHPLAAANVIASIAARLPEHQLERALGAVERIETAGGDSVRRAAKKAYALASIAQRFGTPRQTEVLELAITVAEGFWYDKTSGAQALISVSDFCNEPRRTEVLERALIAAHEVDSPKAAERAYVFASLAQRWPQRRTELLKLAVDAAERTAVRWVGRLTEQTSARTLGSLADCFEEPVRTEVLDRALSKADEIKDVREKISAITELAGHFSDTPRRAEVLQWALRVADSIGADELARARVLISLADCLSDSKRTALLAHSLTVIRGMGSDDESRGELLASLAEKVPDDLLEPTLRAAEEIVAKTWSGNKPTARALASLAERLPEELFDRAIAAAQTMLSHVGGEAGEALALLVERLPETRQIEVVGRALHTFFNGGDYTAYHGEAFIALAKRMPGQLLEAALAVADRFWDGEAGKAHVIASLSVHFPEQRRIDLLERALQICVGGCERVDRTGKQPIRFKAGDHFETFICIADALPERRRLDVLYHTFKVVFERMEHNRTGATQLLSTLIEHIPLQYRIQIVEMQIEKAKKMESDKRYNTQVQKLALLAEHLPDPHRTEVMELALTIAEDVELLYFRGEVFAFLADRMPQPLLDRLHTAIEGLDSFLESADAIARLANRMPEPRRTLMLERALAAMERFDGARPANPTHPSRGSTVACLIRCLPEGLLDRALTIVERTEFAWRKGDLLTSIAGQLSGSLLQRALTIAARVEDETARAHALKALIEQLRKESVILSMTQIADSLPNMSRDIALNWLAEVSSIVRNERAAEHVVESIEDVCRRWR